MKIDPIELSQKLIQCPSITPKDAGALDVVEEALISLGFKCYRLPFGDVDNLYAHIGDGGLCFAGHTDVVDIGDISSWDYNPFAAEIHNGTLIGRGAVDMKTAIAAWIAAISEQTTIEKGLSLIITGDEEGVAVNGTKKVLEWIKNKGWKIDATIVGEPTNPEMLGEMIKIGRRGSMNFTLTVDGVQGHVAYPHFADNPNATIVKILNKILNYKLDDGTAFFQPSNLEITSIDVQNISTNIIPAKATAKFNIRFNDLHTYKSLAQTIRKQCSKISDNYTLEYSSSGDAFLTKKGLLTEITEKAVKEITGITPELSTSGGTSDARFIKDYSPVVEFGLINKTAHKVNECIDVKDIQTLTKIYGKIIDSYGAVAI